MTTHGDGIVSSRQIFLHAESFASRRRFASARRWIGLCLAVGATVSTAGFVFAEMQPGEGPNVTVTLASGLCIRKTVRTFKELKEEHAVRQKYDFSCGAAALTTCLQQYYKLNVTEESVVSYIIHKRGAEDAVRRYKEKKGFSLLDLKMAAASVGFHCAAYSEMTLADLVDLKAPAIVPIRIRDFDHFVVFRGVREDRVYLTDPIVGNSTMKAGNFTAVWRDGVGMILESKKGLKPVDWQPESTVTGYVSEDMTRGIMEQKGLGFVPRGPREF